MAWYFVLLARELLFLLILPTLKVGMFAELLFSSGRVTHTLKACLLPPTASHQSSISIILSVRLVFFFQLRVLSKNRSRAGFAHVRARLKLLLSTEICISIAGSHDPAAVSREHNEALRQFANTTSGLCLSITSKQWKHFWMAREH